MAHPIYHLELAVNHCAVRLRLNGFPLMTLEADGEPSSFVPPVNPYLVGERNMIEVEILPLIREGGVPSTFAQALIEGSVRGFEKGGIVHPGAGDDITIIEIPDELREQVIEDELTLPVSFTQVFSNEGADSSALFSGSAPFDDPDGLLDYGIALRDLAAARDVDGLLVEFQPKLAAYAAAYEETEQAFTESLREELQTTLLAGAVVSDFERGDLRLSPWCGGRVWEISAGANQPLLRTEEDDEGVAYSFQVFAAPIDGHYRIVR